jgi:hypothetical protein
MSEGVSPSKNRGLRALMSDRSVASTSNLVPTCPAYGDKKVAARQNEMRARVDPTGFVDITAPRGPLVPPRARGISAIVIAVCARMTRPAALLTGPPHFSLKNARSDVQDDERRLIFATFCLDRSEHFPQQLQDVSLLAYRGDRDTDEPALFRLSAKPFCLAQEPLRMRHQIVGIANQPGNRSPSERHVHSTNAGRPVPAGPPCDSLLEKLGHLRGCVGSIRDVGDADGLHGKREQAAMVVAGGAGVVAGTDVRADHHGEDMTAAIGDVIG